MKEIILHKTVHVEYFTYLQKILIPQLLYLQPKTLLNVCFVTSSFQRAQLKGPCKNTAVEATLSFLQYQPHYDKDHQWPCNLCNFS